MKKIFSLTLVFVVMFSGLRAHVDGEPMSQYSLKYVLKKDGNIVETKTLPIPAIENEYTPLLKPENQWNEVFKNISLSPEYQYQKTSITKIGDDTLIDGVSYYKLLTTKDSLASIRLNNGYIREEAESRKVYYRHANNPEVLLYDFSLKVGDTIQSYDFLNKRDVIIEVKSISEVLVGSKLLKQINVSSRYLNVENGNAGNQEHTWIEGIGNIDGFLRGTVANYSPGGEQVFLLCFFQNEKLLYKPEDTGIVECFIWK
ncbi:MAG: hypothetical protein LBR45_03145 [Bacteroidales bacterium]|nr:hypothetical protein [Bacteroidales bacterium]